MPGSERDTLRALLRRVDEVRGLSDRTEPASSVGVDETETLVHTLGELVEELERSHRRLIETNVQLVSLREVASSLTNTVDVAETTRTVTRYLQRAFGFDQVCLLLIDRERGVLTGAWTNGRSTAGVSVISTPVKFFEQHLYESEFENHVSHWELRDFKELGFVDVQYSDGGVVFFISNERFDIRGFGNGVIKKIKRIARSVRNEF